MGTVRTLLLFLLWAAAYLGAVTWLSGRRRAKARTSGLGSHGEYRGDTDVWLRLAVLVLGILSLIVVYFAIQGTGRLP